ncbi:hypothetical protein [Leifsonia sp. AG29]|uniref:hypothetical protein n=1 Tax=Leifsonia sp. AG29 TaxID=2598860 RepID=UPI00131AEF4F|nr:hypothetical protein [Leifsonia sp. AG29]
MTRTAALLSAGVLALGLAIGAPVAAEAVPSTTLVSSATTVTANGQVTLTAAGFTAGEALAFSLDSDPLPTYGQVSESADATGKYSGVAVIPTGTTLGTHTITVTGASSPSATATIDVITKPTSSVSPATSALSDYLSTGVTATFSGFAPGSTVQFSIYTPVMGDPAGPDVVVGASGVVTLHFVPKPGSNYANPGTYGLGAMTDTLNIQAAPLSFEVTANPVVSAPAPVAAPATPVNAPATFTG